MRILLLGEYSNVFSTLSKGLNKLGHECIVASGGDGWKDYSRNIDLKFKSSRKGALFIIKNLDLFRNYDVVQIVNPVFAFSGSKTSNNFNYYFFNYIKASNKHVFLSAIGDDYFWVKACIEKQFKYSQFDYFKKPYPESHFYRAREYYEPHLRSINEKIVQKADGIIAGLFEYYRSYEISEFKEKLSFVPFPIDIDSLQQPIACRFPNKKIKFFIGVQNNRLIWKGQDILLDEIIRFKHKYPSDLDLDVAESVPFVKYQKMLDTTDIVIDQLYSYSPAMNALTAMAKAKILVGGGEPEMYKLLGEDRNTPIMNVTPERKQIRKTFEYIFDNKEKLNKWKYDSRAFVEEHHNYVEVAKKYIEIWRSKSESPL